MASYADMAAKGPKQTDAEKYAQLFELKRVPHQIPEVVHDHDDVSIHSLNSQGSINPPSYAEQQKQVEDSARNAEIEAKRAVKQTSDAAKAYGKKAEQEAAKLEKDGKKMYDDVKSEVSKDYQKLKAEASKDYEKVKKQAEIEAKKAKKTAKDAGTWADNNKQNPVVIGNAVVVTAVAGLVGIGAYRKYVNNELTPQVVGIWAGAIGLFALGDYYVSSWLFKNKYPPKN